jgi:ornithine cyclodeaminase/alanine dehydrogenase-like protein (mu-crystallin family)
MNAFAAARIQAIGPTEYSISVCSVQWSRPREPDSVYIAEHEIRAVLHYKRLIAAIGQALVDFSAGRVEQPPRIILRAGNAAGHNNGWFAVMPVIAGDVMAVKTVTFYPGNAERGLPTHMATVELLRRSTGEPLLVMDGRLITEMRTAAVSAVAFSAIAPLHFSAPPRILGILGSGVQAQAHIEAVRQVWPELQQIRIWSRTNAHAERLAAAVGAQAVAIEEAAAADVVLTVTAASEPVLRGRWLQPNALVLAVGATGSSVRELDDEVLAGSYIVAESRSCAERESGDLLLSGTKVDAEIGEILAGPHTAAIPRDRRVLFKSVGMAIEDLTAARLVWEARTRP